MTQIQVQGYVLSPQYFATGTPSYGGHCSTRNGCLIATTEDGWCANLGVDITLYILLS
jgi:hypothetical protein